MYEKTEKNPGNAAMKSKMAAKILNKAPVVGFSIRFFTPAWR